MNSPYQIQNVQLTSAQLLRAVNGLIKYRDRVTRPTLVRWRKQWRCPDPPYTWEDALTFAHYGDLLALGFSPEKAYKYTTEHFKKQGSRT